MTGPREVVVLGGTGFLGRRIARCLLGQGLAMRIASQHPDQGAAQTGEGGPAFKFVAADIADASSAARAVAGAFAVVNAVSLYVERASATYRSIHVDAAATVADSRAVPASPGSSMCQASEPTRAPTRNTSAAAARVKTRCVRRSPTR